MSSVELDALRTPAICEFDEPVRLSAAVVLRIAPVTAALCGIHIIDALQGGAFGVGTTNQGDFGFAQAARATLMILMAIVIALPGHRLVRAKDASVLRLALVADSGLVAAFTPGAFQTIMQGSRMLFLLLVYANVRELAGSGYISSRWCFGVGLFLTLTAVAGQYFGRDRSEIPVGYDLNAMVGLAHNVSLLANGLISVIPFFLLRLGGRSALQKTIVGLSLLIVLLAVLATQRRTSFLAAVIGLAVAYWFLAFSSSRLSKKLLWLLPLLGGTFFLSWIIFDTEIGFSFLYRLSEVGGPQGGTASGRLIFLPMALDYVVSREGFAFFFGEGFARLQEVLLAGFGENIGAHNDWLDIGAALGIPGVALLLAIHLRVLQTALRAENLERAVTMCALAMLLVTGVASGGSLQPEFAPVMAAVGFIQGRWRWIDIRTAEAEAPTGDRRSEQ
jgi:O-antigen ligase